MEHSKKSIKQSEITALFDLATDLFDGDPAAAKLWLLSPQHGLGGKIPLTVAANGNIEEVKDLLGRLEHGIVQ